MQDEFPRNSSRHSECSHTYALILTLTRTLGTTHTLTHPYLHPHPAHTHILFIADDRAPLVQVKFTFTKGQSSRNNGTGASNGQIAGLLFRLPSMAVAKVSPIRIQKNVAPVSLDKAQLCLPEAEQNEGNLKLLLRMCCYDVVSIMTNVFICRRKGCGQ